MSDHDFEKQVQRKLDELRLRPSNAVWTAIEEDIRQHKPRRRFTFWWPLAFVCLAVTGYVVYTASQPARESQSLAHPNSVAINSSSSKTTDHSTNSTYSKDNSNADIAIKNTQPVTPGQEPSHSAQPAGTVTAPANNAAGTATAPITGAASAPASAVPNATAPAIQPAGAGIAPANQPAGNGLASGHQRAANATAPATQPTGTNSAPANANPSLPNRNNRQLSGSATRQHGLNELASNDKAAASPRVATGNVNNTNPNDADQQTNVNNPNTIPSKNATAPRHGGTIPAQKDQQQPGTLASTPAAGAHETSASLQKEPRLPDAVSNTEKELAFATPKAVLLTEPITTEKATAVIHNIALAPTPVQRQPSPRWQFGVTGMAGISRLTQSNLFHIKGWLGSGPLSQEKSQAEDLAQRNFDRLPSNNPGTSSNGTLLNTVPPTPRKAAPIRQGFSWSAGAFAQRPLTKRLRLSIGLQYSYMSMHTTVGKLVERTVTVNQAVSSAPLVNSYYTSFDALQLGNGLAPSTQFNLATVPRDSLAGQNYTYQFHTIELPVTINWQINKGRHLPPFVLDAGFSIAHLLSGDALHYDGTQDIYYKDNSIFTKTQINALMGLNTGLFQRSKLPIWIGPHLRYALTGLVKKELSKGQYPWSAGIQVKMLLNRL